MALSKLEGLKIPAHIGIIMDGNGRWAKKRLLPREAGHREGAKTLRKIVRYCADIGVKYLTLYAFSTENWKRPQNEIDSIMKLLDEYLDEVRAYSSENVRVVFIGDKSMLSENLQKKMIALENDSKDYTKMTLYLAINYGGRAEITNACKQIADKCKNGEISVDDISDELLQSFLYTKESPDADLIIRPSGELRLSNFLTWQSAYSEFYYSDVLWPDFTTNDLDSAIISFNNRDRRFGGV